MDIVTGTKIKFTEGVFGGSWKNPYFRGSRTITGVVLKESYGAKRGQHSFTIQVHDAEGIDADEVLSKAKIRRMGRNVYADCEILERTEDHDSLAKEKHARGQAAKERKYLLWIEEGKLDKVPYEFLKRATMTQSYGKTPSQQTDER